MKSNQPKCLATIELSANHVSDNKIQLFLDIKCNLFRSGLEWSWTPSDLSSLTKKIQKKIEQCLNNFGSNLKEIKDSSFSSVSKETDFLIDNSNLTAHFEYKMTLETSEKVSTQKLQQNLQQCFEDSLPASVSLKKSSLSQIAELYRIKYAKHLS